MAKRINPTGNSLWWQNAYSGHTNLEVEYEMEHGKDIILPGHPIRIKNLRGEFKFRCFVTDSVSGDTWFDCLSQDGQWRSFRVDQLKGPVRTKKRRVFKNAKV